jgi:Ribbon-helix-helix protein, copG family
MPVPVMRGCMTTRLDRMTIMVSFRADEESVVAADHWAERLGIERSELLRDALASHLARLAVEADASAYEAEPFTADETALDAADDWGPAEDWTDWAEWADRQQGE